MMTETKTVEQYMLEELWGRGLRVGETDQALAFAKRKLDAIKYQDNVYLDRKDKRDILIRDCWKTPASEYPQEALNNFYRLIEHHTFTWLVNLLRSKS